VVAPLGRFLPVDTTSDGSGQNLGQGPRFHTTERCDHGGTTGQEGKTNWELKGPQTHRRLTSGGNFPKRIHRAELQQGRYFSYGAGVLLIHGFLRLPHGGGRRWGGNFKKLPKATAAANTIGPAGDEIASETSKNASIRFMNRNKPHGVGR